MSEASLGYTHIHGVGQDVGGAIAECTHTHKYTQTYLGSRCLVSTTIQKTTTKNKQKTENVEETVQLAHTHP